MPSRRTRTESSVRVRLVNPREAAVQLVIEPWGETYSIPPDDAVDIKAWGPEGEALEIAHEPEAIVVWGWPGSTVRVFHNAEELGGAHGRPPVPGATPVAKAPESPESKVAPVHRAPKRGSAPRVRDS